LREAIDKFVTAYNADAAPFDGLKQWSIQPRRSELTLTYASKY